MEIEGCSYDEPRSRGSHKLLTWHELDRPVIIPLLLCATTGLWRFFSAVTIPSKTTFNHPSACSVEVPTPLSVSVICLAGCDCCSYLSSEWSQLAGHSLPHMASYSVSDWFSYFTKPPSILLLSYNNTTATPVSDFGNKRHVRRVLMSMCLLLI